MCQSAVDMQPLAATYKALKSTFNALLIGPDRDWQIDLCDGVAHATSGIDTHDIKIADCPPVKAKAVLRVRNGCGTLRHFSFTDRT